VPLRVRVPPHEAGEEPARIGIPSGRPVVIEVRDDEGKPRPGVKVHVVGPGVPTIFDAGPHQGVTDEQGRYMSPGLRRGRAKVTLPSHDVERLVRTIPGTNHLVITLTE
jgi:hypothetical protein